MTRKKQSAAALLALIMAVILVYPVSATTTLVADGAGTAIAFEDDDPLTISWGGSLTFVVLNNTTLDLQVNLEISEFVPARTSSSTGPLVLAQLPEAVFELPATARKPITVALNPNAQPEPGVYNAWVTLSTGQPATVIRKNVVLSVPVPQVEGLKSSQTTIGSVPPASTAWTLQAYRLLPGMHPVCFQNLSFKCTIPVKVQNPPAVARAGFIGTLNGEKGGGLTVAFQYPRQNHAVLSLEFAKAWSPVGTYSGTLDFLPNDAESGDVALTVNVKDVFLAPLLVVGLGILFAQWAQFYLTVRRGVMAVERRLAQVTVDFEALSSEVVNGYSIKADVLVQRDAVVQALADWSTSRILKPDEEDTVRFKAAVLEPLESLEEGIHNWTGFDAQLQRLRIALDEVWPVIEKAKPPSHLNLDTPRFYIVAQALLHGRAISMRDFIQRQQVVEQAIEFANLWRELEETRSTINEALDFVTQYSHQLSTKARQALEIARRKLSEAHRELWEAGNLTRLRVLRTPDDLEQAKSILNQLMGLIEIGPKKPEGFVPEGAEIVGPWSAEGGTFLGSFEMSVLRNIRARLWGLVPVQLKRSIPADAKAAAQRIGRLDNALMAGDLTLVGLAFLAAVVAGLKPYFTTNFGTLYDYMSAFTWGFGAKAGVELVNAVLERILSKE